MPTKWNSKYQNYVDKYKDIAIAEMLRHHIPASITLAQGLLESGAGDSELARKGNNHFGIKCHGWQGRSTYHDDDEEQECFRAYDNVFDSYEDHSMFLVESQRYRKLFSLSQHDYKGWAKGLKECGYATNPRYAQLLIDIIECYNLHDFDKAKSYNAANIRQSSSKNNSFTTVSPIQNQVENGAHIIRLNNKCYYIIARKGDTFQSLSKEFGTSARKIAKYNERNKKDAINEGDIIYLHKKRTKAAKDFKKKPHTVKPGESMYSIAQQYGIRLKSLYKKNHLKPDHRISVGEKIRVY